MSTLTDARREALEAEGWSEQRVVVGHPASGEHRCLWRRHAELLHPLNAARLADSYIAEAKDVCVCCMGSGLDNTGSGSCLICDGTGKGDYARRH